MILDAMPYAEALVGAYLRYVNIAGDRVYSSIPNDPTYPLVTLHRSGGLPAVYQRLDTARLQIDVWGTSKSEAHSIAAASRVALLEMAGQTFDTDDGWPDNATVTAVTDALGLTWLPDPVTNRDRYTFSVDLYLHA